MRNSNGDDNDAGHVCVIMVAMLAMFDVHVSVGNGGVVESSRIRQ